MSRSSGSNSSRCWRPRSPWRRRAWGRGRGRHVLRPGGWGRRHAIHGGGRRGGVGCAWSGWASAALLAVLPASLHVPLPSFSLSGMSLLCLGACVVVSVVLALANARLASFLCFVFCTTLQLGHSSVALPGCPSTTNRLPPTAFHPNQPPSWARVVWLSSFSCGAAGLCYLECL